MTFALAGAIAASPAGVRDSVRDLLGLALKPDPAPQVWQMLALAAHNIPVVGWPLLLGVWGAHRSRLARNIADTIVVGVVFANTLPVGAALGAYGSALVAYVPQLPIEWAGIALGACGWLTQRRQALKAREGMSLFALVVVVMACSAVVETIAVPHQ